MFTKLPNWCFELLPTLTNNELRVLLVIIRKTIGWGKSRDRIAHTQFETLGGLTRNGVRLGILGLASKGIIYARAGHGTRIGVYRLLRSYENFTAVANAFFDEALALVSNNGLRVYLVLCRKTIGWQEHGEYKQLERIGHSVYMAATGLARNSVRSGLAELMRHGAIAIVWKGTGSSTSTYSIAQGGSKLHPPLGSGGVKIAPSGGQTMTLGGSKLHPPGGSNHDPTKETTKRNLSKESLDDDFWNEQRKIERARHA